MPPRQLPGPQQPQQPRVTGGPVQSVPCPSCGTSMDLRELQAQQLMDTGSEVECDKCKYLCMIVGIQPLTYVTVRPTQRRAAAAQPTQPLRQATTISQAQAQRLLGMPRRGRR